MQRLKNCLSQTDNRDVLLIIGLGLILRSIIALWLFPGYDEAYYYIYSHELDWSYFDHPILVALTAGLGIWLTGIVSQFTIRIGPLILYTGSLWLLYLTAKHLFNPRAAKLTLIIANIIPIFILVFGTFALPDPPLIFFWSATLYCASREFFPQSQETNVSYHPTYRLAWIGLLVGLACLSKYHGFVLGFGLVLFCLTSPPYIRVFLSPWLGLGFVLFIISLFPILFWNSQHDWVSFQFHLSNRFKESQPKSFNILGVLAAFLISVFTLFPSFGFPIWWLSMGALKEQIITFSSGKALQNKSQLEYKKWLILCISLPLVLGMTFFSGYRYAAPSWIMPGFWALTLLLGEAAAEWEKQSKRRFKRWLRGSIIAIVSLFLFVLIHLNLGILQKPSQYALFGGLISPQQDPSREVIDIEQLKRSFIDSPELSQALENSKFIFTNIWFLGGLIDLAIYPIKPIAVTCFCQDTRGFPFWTNQEEWLGKNGLYITTDLYDQNAKLQGRYRPYFKEFIHLKSVPIYRGGEVLEVFHIYFGEYFLRTYP